MSAVTESLVVVDEAIERAAAARPAPSPAEDPKSYRLWIPLLGALWVVSNVALIGMGTKIAYPMICAFAAGIVNGTILSMIAVARASDRFQAGATGLLSGLTLSGLRSDGSMIWKVVQEVHEFVDQVLAAMQIVIPEAIHQVIEQEVLYMIWTTVLVVLASLVAEWVRTARE
jgi:hypothetical protein